MIIKNKYYEFRLGIMLSAVSLEINIGWIGFMWLWKTVNPLEQLPIMEMGPCNTCGATDWIGSNIDPKGGFHECNKCCGTKGGPQ